VQVTEKTLKINDAGWLFAETFRTPMQVGVLANFSMPEDAGDSYLGDLVAHWRTFTTFEAPFNYKLRGSLLPRWEVLPDDAIDLDYHLRHSAVPSPGGERELGILVSRLHSMNMDRRYPLWECHVIEGVAPQCWSVYIKVHHSQVDGVGGIRLAKRMFTTDPDARGLRPPWAVGLYGEDQSGLPPKQRDEGSGQSTRPGARERVVGAARSAGSVVGSLGRTYLETATGSRDDLRAVPWRAPKSILNERISKPRRFATQAYPIDRLRRVAKAADGSLNDVFLAICGGALRRYLGELDALPEQSLTANVPVSVRQEEGSGLGNAISFLYAKLGTDIDDPVDRMKAIHESTRLGKERLPTAGPGAMDLYTTALMGPFLGQAMAGVGGHGPPASNIVISNVPGLQEERYVEGSLMREYYPLSLLFHGMALNITAVSNADTFCIGFTGCRETLPSLQKIAVYTGEALEELEEALGLETQPE
jgi:diacylglycerol O-acyltransferase / wax synthase